MERSTVSELRQRGVLKTVTAYSLAAIAAAEAADLFLPRLGFPDWTVSAVVVLAVIGLPVTIGLSWVYDVSRTPHDRRLDSPSRYGHAKMAALAVVLGATGIGVWVLTWRAFPGARTHTSYASVAVLPFSDRSVGAQYAYLAEGIAEEVLDALAQVEGLRVPAATSSFRFGGRGVDPRVIGDSLDVEGILDGSIQVRAGEISVSVQLVDAADGSLVQTYEAQRRFHDLWAMQEDIAHAVVEAVGLGTDEAGRQLVPGGTADPVALDAYLASMRARSSTAAEVRERIDLLKSAVAADPNFAAAWLALATAYSQAPTSYLMDDREAGPLAEDAFARAYALDTEHFKYFQMYASHLRRWAAPRRAAAAYEAALERNPNSAGARAGYALTLLSLGRVDDAVTQAELAVDLDPLSMYAWSRLSATHLARREYDDALEAATRGLALGDFFGLRAQEIVALAELDRSGPALELAERLIREWPGDGDGVLVLGYAAHRAGDVGRTEAVLQGAEQDGHAVAAGVLHGLLSRPDSAFSWLAIAGETQEVNLRANLRLHSWPYFDPLRDDPRFSALLESLEMSSDG